MPRRNPSRAATKIKRVTFCDAHRELFRLGADDWTPPSEVVVRMGSRTWSFVADFTMPTGHRVRQTVRIDPVRCVVVDERMTVGYVLRGKA